MVINCQGHHLRVALNGIEIINHWMDSTSENKKLTGVGDRPLKGHIGLQDHGTPNNIYFRNIKKKERMEVKKIKKDKGRKRS